MHRFLVTGAGGQLGMEFVKEFERRGMDFLAVSYKELDISDFQKTYAFIKEMRPEIIINCAAYNDVDKAEAEVLNAHKSNALGAYNLAIAASEAGAFLVHYSTDYVFDGSKGSVYEEGDAPNPLNEYGKSKLLGELYIDDVLDERLVFRTSWVYGVGERNFIRRLLKWGEQSDRLNVACDEVSVPTSTKTIVDLTLRALDTGISGLYHLVNSGYCSRYDWAELVLERLGIKKELHPVSKDVFNLPAKRPSFSAMSNRKIKEVLCIEIPEWREELEAFLSSHSIA